MDREQALRRLPRVHSLALRLDALGAEPDLIADCLGIEVEAVRPVLQVAVAKLAMTQQIDLGNDHEATPA